MHGFAGVNHTLTTFLPTEEIRPCPETRTSAQFEAMIVEQLTGMSSSAGDAHAQWLEQLVAMRQAIAALHLPIAAEQAPSYGDDIGFDDESFSGTTSGDDIWDIISDEYDEEYSSDQHDQYLDSRTSSGLYDQQWLAKKCGDVAQRSSGLDAGALKEQVTAILASDSNSKRITHFVLNIVRSNTE